MDEAVEVLAVGGRVPSVGLDGKMAHRSGNSYAAATVTGLVARILEHDPACDVDGIRSHLRTLARADVDGAGRKDWSERSELG